MRAHAQSRIHCAAKPSAKIPRALEAMYSTNTLGSASRLINTQVAQHTHIAASRKN